MVYTWRLYTNHLRPSWGDPPRRVPGDPGAKNPEVNARNFRGEQQNAWGPAYVERPSEKGVRWSHRDEESSGRCSPIWSASGVQPPTTGSTIRTLLHGKINPKDWQVASPLVMQGFSHFLGLFQVIMANPELVQILKSRVKTMCQWLFKWWRLVSWSVMSHA